MDLHIITLLNLYSFNLKYFYVLFSLFSFRLLLFNFHSKHTSFSMNLLEFFQLLFQGLKLLLIVLFVMMHQLSIEIILKQKVLIIRVVDCCVINCCVDWQTIIQNLWVRHQGKQIQFLKSLSSWLYWVCCYWSHSLV